MKKQKQEIIRSTKVSLLESNQVKLNNLHIFIEEYKRVTQLFIDKIWNLNKIPQLLPKEITNSPQEQTWLSARILQCSGKQASGIVRGTRKKFEQRLYILRKLEKENKLKEARRLQKIISENPITKPILKTIEPQLDSRFSKVDLENETSFDGWITLSSLSKRLNKEDKFYKFKIVIPFKKHKHFNRLLSKGILKSGLSISHKFANFSFVLEEKENFNKTTIGVDIGASNSITISNSYQITKDKDGHTLTSILQKLSRKKKGSKSFQKAVQHRTNFINWSLNQIDLTNIKQINIEDFKNSKKFKFNNRFIQHFTTQDFLKKFNLLSQENNVCLKKINKAFTSLRCSECGWTCKSNRNKQQFKCVKCNFVANSDLNASINISLNLENVFKKQQYLDYKSGVNSGFYISEIGKKLIVSSVQKFHNISIL